MICLAINRTRRLVAIRARNAKWKNEWKRETRPSNRRQMSKNKRKMESEPGNTFGVVLREYSRARKAIAFNCELE